MNWPSLLAGVALLLLAVAFWQSLWIADLRPGTPSRWILLVLAVCTASGGSAAFGVSFILRAFYP